MSFFCPKILSMANFRFFPRDMTYRGLSFPNVLIDQRWLPLRAVDLKGSILGQGNNQGTVRSRYLKVVRWNNSVGRMADS